MPELKLRATRKKTDSIQKSLYIPRKYADCVDKIAAENETSFNNVVVSMIAAFVDTQEEPARQEH